MIAANCPPDLLNQLYTLRSFARQIKAQADKARRLSLAVRVAAAEESLAEAISLEEKAIQEQTTHNQKN